MNASLYCAGLAVLLLSVAGSSQAAPADAQTTAGDTCETAVANTVRRMRGREAHEVQFIGAKRAISPSPGAEIGVKGEGRYRGPTASAISFTYSCAFNPETGATNGVVFKEIGEARRSTEAPWKPDLTRLSPETCETAAAAALKDKYPRVGRIAFDGESRKLAPAPDAGTSLEGQGAVERAPGMNSAPFTYRCEYAPNSGKLRSVQLRD